jgi:hypothetical protein
VNSAIKEKESDKTSHKMFHICVDLHVIVLNPSRAYYMPAQRWEIIFTGMPEGAILK